MSKHKNPGKDIAVIIGVDRKFWAEHRVRNQVKALTDSMEVWGYAQEGLDTLDHFVQVKMPPKHLYRIFKLMGIVFPWARIWYEKFFFKHVSEEIVKLAPAFIIAHNIVDAYIAIAADIPYVFDSHEYLPRQFDGTLMWRLMEIRYRRKALQEVFKKASLISVEGEKVERAYHKEFPFTKNKTIVLRNAPRFVQNAPVAHSNPDAPVRIIHHGILVPERGLEMYFDILEKLGKGYHLTLMGGGANELYIAKLKEQAALAGNITIKDPVPYDKIVENLFGHDLAFVFFGSPHYHHKYMTVPNKFWESLQARVPVVVSPDGAMAEYVNLNGCGLVGGANTVESYVECIQHTTRATLQEMKQKLDTMAFEHSVDSWIKTYADTVKQKTNNK